MQQMHEQVATARSVLDEEERGRKHVTKEPARLYQQAQLSLLSEEPALASLQAQASSCAGQLGGVREESAVLNQHELRIAPLQREIDLRRRTTASIPPTWSNRGSISNRGPAHVERRRRAAGQLRAAAGSSADDDESAAGDQRGTVRRLRCRWWWSSSVARRRCLPGGNQSRRRQRQRPPRRENRGN